MAWATDITEFYDPSGLRRQTERAMTYPLGLANPFWLVFGAAAATGAAWWWMSRLSRQANLTAAADAASVYEMAEATSATAPMERSMRKAAAPKAKPAPKAASADPGADVAAETMFEDAEATGYAGAEPAPEAVQAADDLTRMVGVGPRIAAALAARGVTRFADLASWGMAELEAFDRDLKLKGRALRSDWIDQARRLAAE